MDPVQTITFQLKDERKPVTVHSLGLLLGCTFTQAAKHLAAYLQANPTDVTAMYLVSGIPKANPEKTVYKVVSETKLESINSAFSELRTVQIYSLSSRTESSADSDAENKGLSLLRSQDELKDRFNEFLSNRDAGVVWDSTHFNVSFTGVEYRECGVPVVVINGKKVKPSTANTNQKQAEKQPKPSSTAASSAVASGGKGKNSSTSSPTSMRMKSKPKSKPAHTQSVLAISSAPSPSASSTSPMIIEKEEEKEKESPPQSSSQSSSSSSRKLKKLKRVLDSDDEDEDEEEREVEKEKEKEKNKREDEKMKMKMKMEKEVKQTTENKPKGKGEKEKEDANVTVLERKGKRRKVLRTRIDERGYSVSDEVWEDDPFAPPDMFNPGNDEGEGKDKETGEMKPKYLATSSSGVKKGKKKGGGNQSILSFFKKQ